MEFSLFAVTGSSAWITFYFFPSIKIVYLFYIKITENLSYIEKMNFNCFENIANNWTFDPLFLLLHERILECLYFYSIVQKS